uniref:Zinc-ribbon domain-containing protein n=1 Tax=Candidatus Kentrum sp. DK TaxID=2126562 RepID=A0A450TI06_9GAMM|nr:MAG: zinc-ribbon domain-containing protein [Candidatus Kentron sp. DK]
MGSESLFIKCKTCGKEISKTAKTCPHCGEKQKKLSIIHWVGIILVSLFIIGLINAPKHPKESSSSSSIAKVSATGQKETKMAIPSDQVQFIDAVEKFSNDFRDAKNELQQSALRDQRRSELSKLVRARTVSSWVGTISQLGTNTEGKAILSIQVSPDIEIKTWNNALSDINSNTLIAKSSELYSSLFNLSRGQQVEFSGDFFSSKIDYIEETSMTIQGSMRNPEFLFKFKSVKNLN